MWFLVVAMLVILVLAGRWCCTSPSRTEARTCPHVAVGRRALMRKGVDVAPTLDNTSDEVEPPAEHLDLTQPTEPRPRAPGRDS